MWDFASSCIAGSIRLNNEFPKPTHGALECSDNEIYSANYRGEGLKCPMCRESFNIVKNVPYVLWCGHTLCKNCITGLNWPVVKFPPLPFQLPLFISCPWCNLLSLRLVYRGNLKFPRKNFFLLWMVESRNGDRVKSCSLSSGDHLPLWSSTLIPGSEVSHSNIQQLQMSVSNQNLSRHHRPVDILLLSLLKALVFFVQLTAKFPLVLIFLLIVLYVIPANAVILAVYLLITILFALPSILILGFAYPSLEWLLREIIG